LFINWRDLLNPRSGGEGVFTHEVAKRWVAEGHQVSVLTSRFEGALRHEIVDGVRIWRMGRQYSGSFHLLVQRELARVRDFDAVIDEINTAPFFTPLWGSRLPPTIALIHQLAADVFDAELPWPLAKIGRWLEPMALKLYRNMPVATFSPSTMQDLEALGLRKVFLVRQGLDHSAAVTREKEKALTFLFVGRLAANKRPDHAVRAFTAIRRLLPEARLWIVGRGPLEQRLASTLPEGAELLGFLRRDELYDRMARAHCLLVPSVREGWGLVVLEANSVGTPAVGYDVAGLRDSIRNRETGVLASRDDPADLARQAIGVVESSGYDEMSRRAVEWASRFSWETTAADLMKLIVKTAAPQGRR
jgi:glycosyltransferase involved in cell wall biosynthesis